MVRQNADEWYLFVIWHKDEGCPKKSNNKVFDFGPFLVFLTPLNNFGHHTQIWTLLDTLDSSDPFGRFSSCWILLDILDPFGRFWTLWMLLNTFWHFGRFWTLLDDFGQFYCCFFWDTLYTKVMYATSPSPIPEYWVTWAWGYHHPPVTTIVDSLTCKLSLSLFRVASLTLFL